jgi:hypothetical protein
VPKTGLASIKSLHRDTIQLVRETTAVLEEACGWKEIPPKPPAIANLTPRAVAELRASDDVGASHVLRAWNESAVARSFAIADNIGRMRCLLFLLKRWRDEQRGNPDDDDACQSLLKVWHFARDHWGIQTPPLDSRQWDAYCETHVMLMMKMKEHRP